MLPEPRRISERQLKSGRSLREAINRLARPGLEPEVGDRAELNRWAAHAPLAPRLTEHGELVWSSERPVEAVFATIVRDAVDLLSGPLAGRIRECGAPDCALLFVDASHFPLMLAAIAIVTFLLLARAFRSVVLAIKAVAVNLVSLGATFGLLVIFWQNGHGSNLIYGVPATGAIRNWIPIVTFAFLFGISMDYEVFILARMREEYDRINSTPDAVVAALARTGRLVTCGALILAISFASLSTNPDIVVEMIATGLAGGILIDALIVRTLLVPAFVAIMGRFNWWMPDGFARLLRLKPTAAAPDPARA